MTTKKDKEKDKEKVETEKQPKSETKEAKANEQELEQEPEQKSEQHFEPFPTDKQAEGKDALVVANNETQPSTNPTLDQYPTEQVDPFEGMRVGYWHDPQTCVEAEITHIHQDGRVDLRFISQFMVGGVDQGSERLRVRHEYGSRTPGTWDFLFNTQLSYPKPQPASIHVGKDEVIDAGIVKDESGRSKVVESTL